MTPFVDEAKRLLRIAGRDTFAPRQFRRLNPFAVEFRYHDENIALITRDEADQLTQRTLAWGKPRPEIA